MKDKLFLKFLKQWGKFEHWVLNDIKELILNLEVVIMVLWLYL